MSVMVGRKYRTRDSSSWFVFENGRATLVVVRRVGRDSGTWNELTFEGADEVECEAAYARYCAESYERATRQAERRAKWGPLGTGKMV